MSLQGGSYWGGIDSNGSIQNLGRIVFPASTFNVYVQSSPIPEPETCGLMLAGMGMLGVLARRRQQTAGGA